MIAIMAIDINKEKGGDEKSINIMKYVIKTRKQNAEMHNLLSRCMRSTEPAFFS